MHVGTLFPSAKQDGEARGGVVLVRLKGRRARTPISTWSPRGRSGTVASTPNASPSTFPTSPGRTHTTASGRRSRWPGTLVNSGRGRLTSTIGPTQRLASTTGCSPTSAASTSASPCRWSCPTGILSGSTSFAATLQTRWRLWMMSRCSRRWNSWRHCVSRRPRRRTR